VNAEVIRLLVAIGLIGFGIGGYTLVNRLLLKQANRRQLGLEGLRPDSPAILYFTTPYCVPCKTTQRPALERLLELTGEQVQVIQVDAVKQPKLAERWGVLSVPTTFVIDSKGQARRVNHGIASTEKLLGQLEEVEGHPLRRDAERTTQPRHAEAPGTD
jgi:thiol-disulfide isomerase/thioredoxin